MIPKRIYFIWIGDKPIPKFALKNINSWKELNPTFEICKINEKNFDIESFPYIRDAYESGNYAYASDIIRLVTIYDNGGFYFDTDTRLVKPLTPFLNYKSVWALETPGIVASGLVIGAQKNDDDLKNLIEIYKNIKYDPNNLYNLLTTKIVSEYFLSKGLKRVNKFQVLDNKTAIFPSDYFAPYHWWQGGHVTKNTVAIQQYNNSWGSKNQVELKDKIKLDFKHKFPRIFFGLKKIKGH